MRQISIPTFALAALAIFATLHPLNAEVNNQAETDVEACASDPGRLGLSRIVEIDTQGGAVIGGSQPGSTHFLNPGEVVLTFDDGPIKAYTRAVLKALAEQCTKATFFMVGRMAVADPEMVREVAKAGHTIGSHTWSHKNLRPATLVSARREIESAISAISKAKGAPIAPLFRFPYLSSNKQIDAYLKSRNIGSVWIDLDSRDYRTRDPKAVEQRIISQLATLKKGIILMHDIQPATAKMLPSLLRELHDHGFKVVHMVPKAPVATIAAFDDAAEKAIAAKVAARSANPLAPRSMVWTMSPTPAPAPAAASNAASAPGATPAATTPGNTPPAAATAMPANPDTAKDNSKPPSNGFWWPWNLFPN
jgi:peptidoglycan/xylan/chitin deacetylase (PgdA/CDA1 family)